ncbi:hypothetical protein Ahy_A07g032744 [Arachis hypogaea]|uniref:CCHC-type domain-containing protein n=1 Tax=Arachis hypogaea TaxID=3818 RepID=A0A445C7G2_ARAHY|nr:hypothetical protein Ahy_A07g032744 [Arachis hypogaea]
MVNDMEERLDIMFHHGGCVDQGAEDGLDPGVDSDGTNSWHSEEMKTPPNSEDELEEENDFEKECLLFRESVRFGELHLEVGILCVHACAALSRVNKQPEDFCHRWLTMESYRKTYNHHINPILGQPLWEQAENCNRPHAPKIKTKPGKLKMKRRMDADENSGFGAKKPKVDPKLLGNTRDGVHLKRQLGAFTCSFCGEKRHTKRGCKKKRNADVADVTEAAKKKKKDAGHPISEQPIE